MAKRQSMRTPRYNRQIDLERHVGGKTKPWAASSMCILSFSLPFVLYVPTPFACPFAPAVKHQAAARTCAKALEILSFCLIF